MGWCLGYANSGPSSAMGQCHASFRRVWEAHRLSTPVVLEVQPSCLRKVPGSPCHNVPGQVGQPDEGMPFLAIHWTEQVRNNYLELEKPTVRTTLQTDASRVRHLRRCFTRGIFRLVRVDVE